MDQDVRYPARRRQRAAPPRWLPPVAAATLAMAAAGTTLAQGFTDPEDGRFDVSDFLDTAYGFVPLLIPITEPAVGYGALGAAVFIDGEPPAAGEPYQRPNITAIGALRTENTTRGWLAGHLGTWRGGRWRTTAALADLDVNVEFFGLGGDRLSDEGLDYSVKGQGGVLGGSYKVGASPVWLGLRLLSMDTSVTFEDPLLPAFAADDGLRLGALTPSLTIDRRDNFFTPLRGWYVDLALPLYRDDLGSDRDFETANLTGLWYRPLGGPFFIGLRGSVKESSDTTPFFLRPYVALRGVQALEFQGESAIELETEIRWQLGSRYSVVGFVGAGESRISTGFGDRAETVTAGGAGFRYLIARRYGLHLGVDVAGGAGDTVLYVVFGNAWLRP